MDDKKETKATDHKTKAEVVGNLEDVAQNGDCKDGRYLYSASLGVAFDDEEIFILASTKLQACRAILQHFDIQVERVTKTEISERIRKECLKMFSQLKKIVPSCGLCDPELPEVVRNRKLDQQSTRMDHYSS